MEFLDTETSQEHVKVCRVCLIMDVKMHDLQSYPLDTYFEAIIGIPVISTMDLPPCLCYECAGLVRKFHIFKDRCLRGQTVLYGILQVVGKVTEEEIRKIDRESMHLTSNLKVKGISLEQEEDNKTSDLMPEIKEEPSVINNNGIELSVDLGCVKVEHYEELEFTLPDAHYSSEDEPLSLHKTLKEKKKSKKTAKKKNSHNQDLKCISDMAFREDSKIEQESGVVLSEVSQVPRRRRRNGDPKPTRRTKKIGGVRSEDNNLEDFVTIITLTLEDQIAEITKRKESSNYQNAPFQCDLCFKGFIDPDTWKHHRSKHDPSVGSAECEVCKFRFPSRRVLQKHAFIHCRKYVCKACEYVSKTPSQAKQHQKWHKGVTYKCKYCDEISEKWTSYLSHMRIKHPSQHICGVCGYSFVSLLGLNMHRSMMHKNEEKLGDAEDGPYCGECDVKFTSTEAYNRHMVTSIKHSVSNNYSLGCRVCGAKFTNSEEMRLHHRREHARARPKNYGKKKGDVKWPVKCLHCPAVIENARDHWSHYRRAHQDKVYPVQKDYICDVCGKSFRGNAFLNYHKRTHTEERAYKCGECGKAFFNRTNLSTHERTHSDARPYGCDVCFKAFKSKGALDRHYRSHTGEKPYSCEVCGKSFGQSNSRKLHVLTVHLKQPAPYVSRRRTDVRASGRIIPDTIIPD